MAIKQVRAVILHQDGSVTVWSDSPGCKDETGRLLTDFSQRLMHINATAGDPWMKMVLAKRPG